jgi:hypothetical protein
LVIIKITVWEIRKTTYPKYLLDIIFCQKCLIIIIINKIIVMLQYFWSKSRT